VLLEIKLKVPVKNDEEKRLSRVDSDKMNKRVVIFVETLVNKLLTDVIWSANTEEEK
jgi:hypothetical protein